MSGSSLSCAIGTGERRIRSARRCGSVLPAFGLLAAFLPDMGSRSKVLKPPVVDVVGGVAAAVTTEPAPEGK